MNCYFFLYFLSFPTLAPAQKITYNKCSKGGILMNRYLAAIVQLDTAPGWADNMERIAAYIARAAEQGAALVAFPESFSQYLGSRTPAEDPGNSPTLMQMGQLARQHGVWLLCGSLFTPDGDRKRNSSFLLSPEGQVVGRYDKMHMFDVTLPTGETRMESRNFCPGEDIVTVDTPLGVLGMSVCYDIRFPEQYREMTRRGMEVALVPSMFTKPTGRLCWEVLLRARAIENGCYVIAPNQIDGKFGSYGHSMIVDPQGNVLCQLGEEEGMALAEIDLELVAATRAAMPSTTFF